MFKSKSQMNAAFSGYLGTEMKKKAREFAHATPNIKGLSEHAKKDKRPAVPDLKKVKGK
jgi:hypothetical protein